MTLLRFLDKTFKRSFEARWMGARYVHVRGRILRGRARSASQDSNPINSERQDKMTSSVDRGALESLLALAPLIIGGLWLLAALTAFMTISIRSDRPLALLSKFDKSHATSIEQIVRRQWSQV